MRSVDEVLSRIPSTVRALMALSAAVAFGALGNNALQSYIGVPAQMKEDRERQAVRDSIQDYAIETHMLEYRRLDTRVEGLLSLERLPEVVEELAFQLCLDRADRRGTLTAEVSAECRRDAQRADPGGGSP